MWRCTFPIEEFDRRKSVLDGAFSFQLSAIRVACPGCGTRQKDVNDAAFHDDLLCMRDFHKLRVWNHAHLATLDVYRATKTFPKDELYGLTGQMRRAATSICANLAEGCGRRGGAEFARFLDIALGSASELEYHLLLSVDLKLLDGSAYARLNSAVVQVKRMLAGLLRKLRAES